MQKRNCRKCKNEIAEITKMMYDIACNVMQINKGKSMDYIRRIIDDEIDKRIKAFNAINIVGPKGCGKTRTASERCKTVIEFQDEEKRSGYLLAVEASPALMFKREKPILFDEWQDAPKLWGGNPEGL